jgi:Tol biopolymer transport system component
MKLNYGGIHCYIFVLGFLLPIVNLNSQTFKVENSKPLCCDSLTLTKPVWSSDGNSLLLSGGNNRGLYVYRIGTERLKTLDTKTRVKSKPVWLKNGEIIYLKGQSFELVSNFKSTENILSDTVLIIDSRNRKIMAESLSNGKTWEITHKKALYYNPLISPNKRFAIIHLQSQMYLYATDGSGLIKLLGTGIASSWSPDGKFVFYFLDESIDGHNITNSEIYVLSLENNTSYKLTETPGIFEMWPAVSPDGKKIAFTDEKSGKIFLADLIVE